MERKLAVEVNEDNVGYLPMKVGQFPGRQPSRNAAFFLRRDREPDDPLVLAKRRFHGLNQWPAELPGFRETALAYMQAMETLCRRLVPIYATALDLPPDAFDRAYAEPHLILRLTHYPPLASGEAASVSLTPHTDSGFMTLLAPNPVPGLSILLPDGRWVDAPAVADAFVVNGGDILHRWTNERFLSTPHRVINRTAVTATRSRSSATRTTTRSSNACRAAARRRTRRNTRRSSSVTMRSGSPARATSTWHSSPRLPTRRSRRARGRRCAGEPRRRRHPPVQGPRRLSSQATDVTESAARFYTPPR